MAISMDGHTLLSYIFSKGEYQSVTKEEYNVFTNNLIQLLSDNQDKNSEFKYFHMPYNWYDYEIKYLVKDGDKPVFIYADNVIYPINKELVLDAEYIEHKYDYAFESDIVSNCLKEAYNRAFKNSI